MKRVQLGHKGVPYLVTHDGRTIRYPDPAIRVNDTIRLTLPTKLTSEEKPKAVGVAPHGVAPSPKIDGFIHFEVGNLVACTGGRNIGRAGIVVSKERHLGGFDIVHVRDAMDKEFSTRATNVFVIGEGNKPWISLPKNKGIKLSITEGKRCRCRARVQLMLCHRARPEEETKGTHCLGLGILSCLMGVMMACVAVLIIISLTLSASFSIYTPLPGIGLLCET